MEILHKGSHIDSVSLADILGNHKKHPAKRPILGVNEPKKKDVWNIKQEYLGLKFLNSESLVHAVSDRIFFIKQVCTMKGREILAWAR